jgi:DNA-binding NarL/FixJ family response regulator
MRRLRNARSTLAQLRRFAPKPDGHISGNIAIADAKLAIAGGDLKRAAAALQHVPTTNVSPGFTGEFLAYRGLVQAAAGDLSRAEATYSESQSVSRYVDSVSAQTIGEAIMLAQSPGSPGEYVRAKVQSVVDIGHRDMVLTGCRAYPQLAAICVESGELRKALSELFETSRDFDLARSAGIVVPRAHRRGDSLSSREEEILDLLSQGRTNRQIAETLFISESTAKVHVRHIFEKLGVHSRVESVAWLQEMD